MTGKYTPTPWAPDCAHMALVEALTLTQPILDAVMANKNITAPMRKAAMRTAPLCDAALAKATRAVNSHAALVKALEECTNRFRSCMIANGTDDEYADIAIEPYRAALALVGKTP